MIGFHTHLVVGAFTCTNNVLTTEMSVDEQTYTCVLDM